MSEIKMVRLGALEHDPVAIAGNEKRLTSLNDLLASIPAKGLNQSLRVRPWVGDVPAPKGKGKKAAPADPAPEYGVIAGNRRLATLRKLRDDGIPIMGVAVTDDWPVPVLVGDENDADAFEITSTENLMRQALSPVEEFRAFDKMAKKSSIKEVASHFGVTERRVAQRLKLAALHPDVLGALETGKIGMEAAEAFTVEPDPEKQAAYLRASAKDNWRLQAHQIKSALVQQLTRDNSPVAQLIGREVYVAAGGEVMADPFGEAEYWISDEIIARLLAEHWGPQKAAWLADGWGFVETEDEFNAAAGNKWALYDSRLLKPFEAVPDEDYTAEQKAGAGVVYWPDGSRAPRLGSMRPHKQAAVAPLETLDRPGWQVMDLLRHQLAKAVGVRLKRNADLALQYLVASQHREFLDQADDDAPAPPQGNSFAEALSWARQQDQATLLAYHAEMLGELIGEVALDDEDDAALVSFVEADATEGRGARRNRSRR